MSRVRVPSPAPALRSGSLGGRTGTFFQLRAPQRHVVSSVGSGVPRILTPWNGRPVVSPPAIRRSYRQPPRSWVRSASAGRVHELGDVGRLAPSGGDNGCKRLFQFGFTLTARV